MAAETLHAAIDTVARRHPDRVAVIDSSERLTYGALTRRTDEVARTLLERGVEPGDRVGVHMGRGVDLVVAVLAVLKTGAAYVPLDPTFPAARLALMVEDAGVRTVLAGGSGDDLAVGVRSVVTLEEASPDTATEIPEGSADDLAYVIYTSGSTGRPKGVKLAHRSVLNLLRSMIEEPGIAPDDRWLAVTTLSFDISVLELFGPLLAGACTWIASSEDALDGGRLRELLGESGATVMQATPVSWRMLLEAGWSGPSGFKALSGGEALPRDLAEELLGRVGELWNMYGPTETTIWSTCHRVRPGEPILIGRPVAATTVHVLDPSNRPVPPGVAGELFIGGAGVAAGYHERPELDAERFLPDPFSAHEGARMYRTGDVVRQRRDGALEYLSRVDDQVKIRGFRVELGEIEVGLRAVEGVLEAVVAVRRGEGGDDRLVAFVRGGPSALDAGVLRDALSTALPAYMVPQHFQAVDEIPTTPNGKVDRNELLARHEDASRPEEVAVAPGSPTEFAVVEIMAEILDRPALSADADFFAVGGHSVLAMRVIARLRSEIAPDVTLRDFFENPTAIGLAAAIDGDAEVSETELVF